MISDSLMKTRALAQDFLHKMKVHHERATVVGLRGDLGAGKTAFVQQVASLLGVMETITSPTFVIEKIYKLDHKHFSHLIHIDAYRLESDQELRALGWNVITADPKNLIMIEWPENVAGCMPEEATFIDFKFIDEATREITFI